jgi:1-deoxy-D-xylulose-5-phosphate synthase
MKPMLEKIESPADLKGLSIKDLNRLSREIRNLIIRTVSKTGGHLSPNLGVVELSLALHYVFDSPRDQILWDVGHQCYTHKIVTGRKAEFAKLRQFGGVCGFPCREESPHDIYNTGHASTALSAAMGLAVARDKKGGDFHVIAVVGDGGLTGGIAWEALNQIGHHREKLIIVLNYNEMSIAPNVGAMSRYLSYLVSGQHYLRMKDHAKTFLKALPVIGWPLIKLGRAFEDAIKKIFFPGLLFEELGLRYIGPVQGHSLRSLIEVFEDAKRCDGPVLVLCVTKKGKGYAPAQDEPARFHSASPFEIGTGKTIRKSPAPTYSEVFGKAALEFAEKNPAVVAITAAMPEGTGLDSFARRFPERFFDVGIAEQHAVDFATGLALGGFRPLVAIYSTFLQRAYDQLYHDVGLMDVPIVFALDRSGVVPDDGPTHQGINDIVYLRHLPNFVVMAPKDANELRGMVTSAFEYGHPVAIRFPKGKVVGAVEDAAPAAIPLGKAEVLREGSDLLLAFGNTVYPALEAAERLEAEGIRLTVVNARFAIPLDKDLILERARKGGVVFTVEEGVLAGGFGSAVRELLDREARFDIRFKSLGLPLEIYPVGKAEQIRSWYKLDSAGLEEQIRAFYLS